MEINNIDVWVLFSSVIGIYLGILLYRFVKMFNHYPDPILTTRGSLSSMTKSFNHINKEKHMTETLRNGETYRVDASNPDAIVLRRYTAICAAVDCGKIKPGMLVAFRRTPDILRPVVKVENGNVYCWKRDRDDDNMLTTDTTYGPTSNIFTAVDHAGNTIISEGRAC